MFFTKMYSFSCSISIFTFTFLTLSYFIRESSQGRSNYPTPFGTSPVYLQYLENVEARFYKFLKGSDLSKMDMQVQSVVETYLKDYEESVKKHKNRLNIDNDHVVSDHPILSLQMISRFIKYSTMNYVNIFTSVFNKIIEPKALPGPKEIEEAGEAFFRILYIYDIDIQQLANGTLYGIPTNVVPTPEMCYEFAFFGVMKDYFTLTLQWFEVALQKLKKSDYSADTVATVEEQILKSIKETIEKHNKKLTQAARLKKNEHDTYSFTVPIHHTSYSANAHLTQKKRMMDEFTGKFILDKNDPNYVLAADANELALCNGRNLQSEKMKAKLKCFYDTSRHSYWKINPLKIEVLHEAPKIIRMYEIIGDKAINVLKNLSYYELKRASILESECEKAAIRTAAYAWFKDDTVGNITFLKAIKLITGLNVMGNQAADDLQVAAYGVGAYVERHHDSFSQGTTEDCTGVRSSKSGHRIATFLTYLNDVEAGGRTVFPLLGLSIKPVKNSAILYHTNFKNGKKDNRTYYAACPVIKGHKWIATKWIRGNGNMLTWPCGLTPDK